MEKWFRFFDDEYFGGKLPTPELGVTRAKTRLGQMAYKRATRWGRTKLYDFKISMSTYYDMTEKQAKSVLLHEMIHYMIGYTGLKDTSSHGIVFRGMMDKLNRTYGWDIRVMTSTKGWKVSEQVVKKEKGTGSADLSDFGDRNAGWQALSLTGQSRFCPSYRRSVGETSGGEIALLVHHPGKLL